VVIVVLINLSILGGSMLYATQTIRGGGGGGGHFTAPLLALIIAAADAQSKKMTMMKIGAKIISFE